MEFGVGEDPRVGGVDSGPSLCSGDAFWRLGDPDTTGETEIPENEIGVRLLRPPLLLSPSPSSITEVRRRRGFLAHNGIGGPGVSVVSGLKLERRVNMADCAQK